MSSACAELCEEEAGFMISDSLLSVSTSRRPSRSNLRVESHQHVGMSAHAELPERQVWCLPAGARPSQTWVAEMGVGCHRCGVISMDRAKSKPGCHKDSLLSMSTSWRPSLSNPGGGMSSECQREMPDRGESLVSTSRRPSLSSLGCGAWSVPHAARASSRGHALMVMLW